EDGIRDYKVTGVQTCALPISSGRVIVAIGGPIKRIGPNGSVVMAARIGVQRIQTAGCVAVTVRIETQSAQPASSVVMPGGVAKRSEERRVGKECRCGWGADR